MPLHLDLPDKPVGTMSFIIAGWAAGPLDHAPIALRVNGRRLDHDLKDFPAVRAALPTYPFVSGLVAKADLMDHPASETLEIVLSMGDERTVRTVPVEDAVRQRVAHETVVRRRHRRWCEARLRCPICAGSPLVVSVDALHCGRCGAVFEQTTRALNLISPALRLRANLAASDNVSSNPYTPAARSLIARTWRRGGWILDCGAGARPRRHRQVINLEIADYPSTDVLAIGEALPFEDNTFDAVLSLAVLEHVRDPFACARELVRVAKPGATILVDAPGLQPLHGYPHHYYNMTRQGLRNLFEAHATIVESYTAAHGHPIWALQWLIDAYIDALPASVGEAFASKTLAELRARPRPEDFARAPIAALSDQAMEALACVHTLVVEKP